MRENRKFWVALLILAALTPVGIYLPHILKAGAAWGEWGIGEVKERIGYSPEGMEREAGRWKAPLPEYALPGEGKAPLARRSISYIASAVVGIAACGAGGYLLARWLRRRR